MVALQTCLPESVWKKIGRHEGISRVWEKLDSHYGATKIVTAEVMAELDGRTGEDFLPTSTIMLEDAARLVEVIDQGDRVKSEQQDERGLVSGAQWAQGWTFGQN